MKKIVLAAGAAILALGAAAFTMQSGDDAGPPHAVADASIQAGEADLRLPAISVATARIGTLTDVVRASGLVQPREQVHVQPEIEGQAIRALEADVGDQVKRGDPLAILATDTLELRRTQLQAGRAASAATIAQLEAQIVEARASADEAERARRRNESLAGRGMVSQAALDQAEAAAKAAKARVAAAREGLNAARAQLEAADAQLADVDFRLGRATVVAPVDGIVSARNARLGAIASAAGEPMFVLIRDGELEVRADVAERDIARIAVGQRARIQVAGAPTPLVGSVRLIEPTVDAATRLGRVRIALSESDRIRAGMFADALIEVARVESIVVPAAAVGSGPSVLRVEDGVARRVPVRTGLRDGEEVAIVEGLAEGATVVARAGAFVRDGDRIRPVQSTERAR